MPPPSPAAASALDGLGVGFLRLTPAGSILEANGTAAGLLGFPEVASACGRDLLELVADSRQREDLVAGLVSNTNVCVELRVGRPGVESAWVALFARPSAATGSGGASLDAVLLDVREHKRIEEESRTRSEHYRTLVQSFPDGAMILLDPDLRLLVAESAALAQAGFPREALEGRSLAALLPTRTFALVEPRLHDALTGTSASIEVPFGERTYNVEVRPVKGARGEVVYAMAVVQDITGRKRVEEKLRYLSAHDPLTNLFNRLFFEEEMARLAKGRHFPISVVVADVDGLKSVNDRLGHAAGDELLRQAADLLRGSFRPGDVVARIGGDEFGILLPGASAEAGESVVARVRRSEDAQGLRTNFPRVHFSLGLATADEGESLAESLRLADSRMYRDKMARSQRAAPPPGTPGSNQA